ncbi:MAG: glycerophosphodiester phosphodiesterase [Dysgonomonas sp.]
MKQTIILFILCLSATVYVPAQQGGELLSLDKYSIPVNKKGVQIGTFLIPDNEKVLIVKDTANIFQIEGGKHLRLKKNKVLSSKSPSRHEITVQYAGKTKAFELVKDEFLKNKVVAHRGAWKHYDVHQNSLGALKKAIELGCEASEFDVWLSKDNRVVLNHDHEINGLIVEETNLAKMQEIILESGEVMATLEEYLDCVKTQNKTRLVLEIKSRDNNKRALALVDSAVNIVHRLKAQAWVDYISFDYEALMRIRALDASAHIAYLGANRPLDLQKVEGMSGIDYHFSQFDKIERLYDRARALGLTINIWTVNDELMMKNLLRMDVDFITTDEPEILLRLTNKL